MKTPHLDRQAAATLLAGSLLIAISFLTNYGHGAILHLSSLSWVSRSEYLSTLPLCRRCLAMLNWRPVFEIEQETTRLRQEKENLKQETERLRKGNERLDAV
jgi:hypothetical protein